MKTSLLSVAAAFCLLASTTSHAATLPLSTARETHQDDQDKNRKHDKDHKPTAEERAKWEAEHNKNSKGKTSTMVMTRTIR